MKNQRKNDTVQIHDDDRLYRRIPAEHFRPDGRIDYATYIRSKSATPDPEISVDLAHLTTPKQTLEAAPSNEFGLGVLKAADVREIGFTVRYKKSKKNKAHCIIEGVKTETDCARLADITRILILPPTKPGAS